jgi:histidyl-tRNA synthetase
VKINNRKVLDGVLDAIGLGGEANAGKRLTVLRAIDKLDRLGAGGVRALLGPGRKDESGDFTKGAGLGGNEIERVLAFTTSKGASAAATMDNLSKVIAGAQHGSDGVDELRQIAALVSASGYADDRIVIDPSVVRGLEYYTGPVYEVELTFETRDEEGRPVRFGSVGGGGRYDGLIARFRGEPVPATGFSIGVSRLLAALTHLGKVAGKPAPGPVVVLAMDRERITDYQRLVGALRGAGIRAELYLGSAGMKAQMKYADRRGAPCVVIQGSDEKARGEVQIKDLIDGAKAAAAIASNQEWRETRPAQFSCAEGEIVAKVREVLARHDVKWGI